MYVCINCLNSSFINSGIRIKAKLKIRANLKFKFKKFKIAKSGILKISLPNIIVLLFFVLVLLKAENLSVWLEIVKLYSRFFW